jgi:3alpha(or 20beta)-hydroxysteroid dehydrogenase
MLVPYVSSKRGVRRLTQTAATELARDMIRVNVIRPGVITTPLITRPLRPGEVPVSEQFSAKPFAVPRMGEPVEVTQLVMFLASEDSAFITGSDCVIDGGMLLGVVLPSDN